MYKIKKERFSNQTETYKTAKTMKKTVELLRDNRLWTSALVQIGAYINVLSNGDKSKYIQILKAEFPDLCEILNADIFYENYRNGLIPAVVVDPLLEIGYAIVENKEIDGKYVSEIEIENIDRKYIGLNIERLINDFIKFMIRIIKRQIVLGQA